MIEHSHFIKILKPEDVMKDLEIKDRFIISEGLRFTRSSLEGVKGRKSDGSSGSPFEDAHDSSFVSSSQVGEMIPYAEAI